MDVAGMPLSSFAHPSRGTLSPCRCSLLCCRNYSKRTRFFFKDHYPSMRLVEENNMADFKNKVVYQIYPKSFKDSNGDGIGDLRGVIDALDYLADMGVDYLWLTPFFVSPQKDNGYDIADYLAIDPHFGTMDDFDALVKAADAKGLKVMLDMVLCHTSDQHAWFRRALAGDESYQRYYILRDGRNKKSADDPGDPPTNWQCAFGGSAWQ